MNYSKCKTPEKCRIGIKNEVFYYISSKIPYINEK